jgi:membrane peptidoglycan carboxypeptidase
LAVVALPLGLVVVAGGAAWFASPRPVDPEALAKAETAARGGTWVPFPSLPAALRAAVVDTEDERFWHDHGVDVIGLGRAFAYDVTHLTLQQGASTITEQLAKVLYLGGDDHSPSRKLEDAAVAVRLEGLLTKEQILAAYLNSVYFGDGATGIGRAAMRYFGVPASRLSLSEASLLAGLIQAPSSDDPVRFPQLARLRQADVLRSMVRNGDASPERARAALAQPLRLASGSVVRGLTGVDLSASAQYSTADLAAGFLLIAVALTTFVALRRRIRPGLVWRLVPTLMVASGLLLLVGSIRMD